MPLSESREQRTVVPRAVEGLYGACLIGLAGDSFRGFDHFFCMQSERLRDYLWEMEDQPGFGHLAPVTVFSVSTWGDTPLHVAVRRGDVGIAAEMLAEGADVDAIGQDNFSALHFAVMFDDVAMVRLLLENGASLNTLSDWGESPADSAVRLGVRDIVEAIQAKMALS